MSGLLLSRGELKTRPFAVDPDLDEDDEMDGEVWDDDESDDEEEWDDDEWDEDDDEDDDDLWPDGDEAE